MKTTKAQLIAHVADLEHQLAQANERKRYNGWDNYETWNVALWIGNDQGSVERWEERAKEIYVESERDGKYLTKSEQATNTLADEMKEDCEENNPLNDRADNYTDLLGAAISEVNWHEIASHYISSVEEEFRDDLKRALEKDHCGICDSTACDIDEAHKNGFTWSAAHLLTGATDCPNVESVIEEYGSLPMDRDGWPEDWEEWTKHFQEHGKKCACGAFNFDSSSCGNCGKEL